MRSRWESRTRRRRSSAGSAASFSTPANTGPTTCPAWASPARTSSTNVRRRCRGWSAASRAPASGLWLDEGRPHREHAADFVARYYYNQPPELLRHALTQPLDRVIYTRLSPRKPDFDMVRDLMIQTGVLDRKIEFDEYVEPRFAEGARGSTAWKYEPGGGKAEETREPTL